MKKQLENDLIKGQKQNEKLLKYFYKKCFEPVNFTKDCDDWIKYTCELAIIWFGTYDYYENSNPLSCLEFLKLDTNGCKWDQFYHVNIKNLQSYSLTRHENQLEDIEQDLLHYYQQWIKWKNRTLRLDNSKRKLKRGIKLNNKQIKHGLKYQVDSSGLSIYESEMEALIMILKYPYLFKNKVIYQSIWKANQCSHIILNQPLFNVIHKLSRMQSIKHCINKIKTVVPENTQMRGNFKYNRNYMDDDDDIDDIDCNENIDSSWLCHGLTFQSKSNLESFINDIPFYPSLIDEKYSNLNEILKFVDNITESKCDQSIKEMSSLKQDCTCDKSKCDIYDIGIRYDAILPLIECYYAYKYDNQQNNSNKNLSSVDFGSLTKNGQRLDVIIMLNKYDLMKQAWNFETNKCLVGDVNIDENVSNHTIDKINYLTQVLDVDRESALSLNLNLFSYGNHVCSVKDYDPVESRNTYLLKPTVLLPYQQKIVTIKPGNNDNSDMSQKVVLLFCRTISYHSLCIRVSHFQRYVD